MKQISMSLDGLSFARSLTAKSIYTMYIHLSPIMVRRMKATITQIESVVRLKVKEKGEK
jgi:hypothetical protein